MLTRLVTNRIRLLLRLDIVVTCNCCIEQHSFVAAGTTLGVVSSILTRAFRYSDKFSPTPVILLLRTTVVVHNKFSL